MTVGIMSGNVQKVNVISLTIDPASVDTITTAEQTFTLSGAKIGDIIFVNKPSCTAGLGIAGARVTAVDTIGITFVNPTAGGINAASEVWNIAVVRAELDYRPEPGIRKDQVSSGVFANTIVSSI